MKYLAFLIACCAMIIPSTSDAAIDLNLKYGSSGFEVTELQQFLINKNFLTGPATGLFFSMTLRAVKDYQASVGISATGFVGLLTRKKINEELALVEDQVKTAEVGTTASTTKNDVVATLQKQIDALLVQLQRLNSQVQTQTTVQRHIEDVAQQTQTTIQQTQHGVEQIQQNTTPAPLPTPPQNKLNIQNAVCGTSNNGGLECSIRVLYTSNTGARIMGVPITVISNGIGDFVSNTFGEWFVSASVNHLTTLSKATGLSCGSSSCGDTYSGVEVTYMAPGESDPYKYPTFTATTPDGLSATLKSYR